MVDLKQSRAAAIGHFQRLAGKPVPGGPDQMSLL